MPIKHVVEGPFLVEFRTETLFDRLCYNVGNTSIIQEDKELPYYSDSYGGDAGEPADIHILGGVIAVPIESRHYDRFFCMKLQNKQSLLFTSDEGQFPDVGSLVKQGVFFGDLRLVSQRTDLSPGDPWVYHFFCARPINFSPAIGLVANTFRCVFQCIKRHAGELGKGTNNIGGTYPTALPFIGKPRPNEIYRVDYVPSP
jgi:hypothetical protein